MKVAPRDVVAAALPNPATLGDRMTRPHLRGHVRHGHRPGRAAAAHVPLPRRRQRAGDAGVRVAGGRLQTALNPIVALELLADGTWAGAGVLGPEAFPAEPFLDRLADYGWPHGVDER